MNPVSLPPEIQRLKRLWTQRFKALMEADRLLGTEKNKDVAHAYLQCAEELENPPLDLLNRLIPDILCEPALDKELFHKLAAEKKKMEQDHKDVIPPDIDASMFQKILREKMEKDNSQAIPPKFECGCRPGETCIHCS